MNAPIILFAYRRPWHLAQVVDSLLANPSSSGSDLIVFSDASRSEKDSGKVAAVRDFLGTVRGFRNVQVIRREENYGLSRNIVQGVSAVLGKHGKAIVLEDDITVSNVFLEFMNQGLEQFASDDSIASITGFAYEPEISMPSRYLLPFTSCWGWGTWMRSWNGFRADGSSLLHEIRSRKLSRKFDLDGTYPYSRMLEDQIAGRNDSWAIRWYASTFLKDQMTIYPEKSLVSNIGWDGTGEHCENTSEPAGSLLDSLSCYRTHPRMLTPREFDALKRAISPRGASLLSRLRRLARLFSDWIRRH